MRRIYFLLVVVMATGACGANEATPATVAPTEPVVDTSIPATTSTEVATEPNDIVLMSHDSLTISESVVAEFTALTGRTVTQLKAGDAGSALNQAILTKDRPLADLLFGVDNTFLSRALDNDIFEAYQSPGLEVVPAGLQLDPQHRVTPIDFGDVCLNYDISAFGEIAIPETLLQLTEETYADLLVVQNPATSSPGLAFLLATIAEFGEDGDYTWQDYWADLRSNGVLVAPGWEAAYYGEFSYNGGTRPLVVSYASSPPAEVIFSDPPLSQAPTGVITAGCFRQIEFAGVLADAKAPEGAKLLIDFMLSRSFQEDIPLNNFVFPASIEAELPPEFVDHTVVPERPATLEPSVIETNRERWIEEWTAIFQS